MLYRNRIDVSEGVDGNKKSASKECTICHCCYFLDKGFMFKQTLSGACHYVLIMSFEPKNFDILNVYGVYYQCIISKTKAVNLFKKMII